LHASHIENFNNTSETPVTLERKKKIIFRLPVIVCPIKYAAIERFFFTLL
jgi:hypothetical protein